MTSPTWKQVSAAECLKWQIDNPMKDASRETALTKEPVRFNEWAGSFEYFSTVGDCWCATDMPACRIYTYFIPEVTEPRYIDPKYSEEQTPRMGH